MLKPVNSWKESEIRPTSRRRPRVPRGRRRADLLVNVTHELRAWFEADRAQSGRDLLSKLQVAHPGEYPDALLRTVQRRLKTWRAEMAKASVFDTNHGTSRLLAPDALRDIEASRIRGKQARPTSPASLNEIRRDHSGEATG